jgi:hypothetical protein
MSIIQLPFFRQYNNQRKPKPKTAPSVGQNCIEARSSPNCLHSFVGEWLPALSARGNPYNNGNQNKRKTKIPERYRRGEVNTCLGSESCHQCHRRKLPRFAQPAAKFFLIKDQRPREKPDLLFGPPFIKLKSALQVRNMNWW